MANEDALYRELRNQIQSDLKPVRPMAPAWKRVSPVFAIWAILAGFVLLTLGLRRDVDALGSWVTWSLPLIQIMGAYTILTFALRLTVPASEISSSVLALLALFGIAMHLIISEIIFGLSPVPVEPGRERHLAAVCFAFTLVLGLVPLIFIGFLSNKGLPSRPGFLGLVCGLGCGLSGDAVWRLHCPYNSWDHILTAHSGAILATTLLGFCLGFLTANRRKSIRKSK
jgi:hypothetical protein